VVQVATDEDEDEDTGRGVEERRVDKKWLASLPMPIAYQSPPCRQAGRQAGTLLVRVAIGDLFTTTVLLSGRSSTVDYEASLLLYLP
jgi:hypothetical protein